MAAITVDDLTTGTVDGTGVFDDLMRAMKAHLDQEYNKNRIRGADYAQVYLGATTAVMQQAVAFLMGQQQADKQADLLTAQIAEVNKQVELLTQQITNLQAEKLRIDQQTANLTAEAANIPKQGAKIDSEKALTDQQTANALTTNTTLVKQQTKLDSEVALLDQKKLSEEAQILDTVDGNSVEGVIGKQKALYSAQTDGFSRDAEQKLAKQMLDIWSIQRTTDDAFSPAGAGIENAEIKKVIDKAKEGIGVVPG